MSYMKTTLITTPVVAVAPYQTGITVPHTPVTMATQVHKPTVSTSMSSCAMTANSAEISTKTAWVNGVPRNDFKETLVFTTTCHKPKPGLETNSTTCHKPKPGLETNITTCHKPKPGLESNTTTCHKPKPGLESNTTIMCNGDIKHNEYGPLPISPSQPLKFMNGAMNKNIINCALTTSVNSAFTETKSSSSSSKVLSSRLTVNGLPSAVDLPNSGRKACDKTNGSVLKVEQRYYRGNLSDKLSDYEDICNMPQPKQQTEHNGVIKTVKNGPLQNEDFKIASGQVLNGEVNEKKGSMTSDRGSEIIGLRHIMTENLERGGYRSEPKDDLLRQVLKPKDEPAIFTFDFITRRSPPTSQPPPPPQPSMNTPIQSQHRERQFSSPAYAEPYDSRIGKVDGVSTTKGAIKVSNSLHAKPEEEAVYKYPVPSAGSVPVIPNGAVDKIHIDPQVSDADIPVDRLNDLNSVSTPPGMINITKYHQSQAMHNSCISQTSLSQTSMTQTTKVINGTNQFTDLNFQELNDVLNDLQNHTAASPSGDRRSQSQSVGDRHSQLSHATRSETQSREASINRTMPSHVTSVEHSVGNYSNQNGVRKSSSRESLPHQKQTVEHIIPKQVNHFMRPPPISKSFEENFFQSNNEPEEEWTNTMSKFPVHHYDNNKHGSVSSNRTSFSESSTVEDLISDVSPDLTVKPLKPLTISNLQRMSEYDNISGMFAGSSRKTVTSSVGTNYCKPWDSTLWDDLLHLGSTAHHKGVPNAMATTPTSLPGHHQVDDADYSSVYMDSLHSLCESSASHLHSENRTEFESELATSFEWQRHDCDSATDALSQTSNAAPGEDTDDEGLKLECRCGPIKQGEVNLQLQRQTYISDDEGVDDDENEIYTDSFKNRIMPFLCKFTCFALTKI